VENSYRASKRHKILSDTTDGADLSPEMSVWTSSTFGNDQLADCDSYSESYISSPTSCWEDETAYSSHSEHSLVMEAPEAQVSQSADADAVDLCDGVFIETMPYRFDDIITSSRGHQSHRAARDTSTRNAPRSPLPFSEMWPSWTAESNFNFFESFPSSLDVSSRLSLVAPLATNH
jgi:hypothetical protein